ncbi:hypothetical protein COOONC_21285, partial [Cooperia oncophora]
LPKPQRKLSSSTRFSDELPSAINYLAKQGTLHSVDKRVYSPTFKDRSKTNKDVKRVLKVSLSSIFADYIQDAVHIALESLHLKYFSELIISFPITETMVQIPFHNLVTLVERCANDSCSGVSDLEFHRFQMLYEGAKRHKPTIYHYSFDGMINCEVNRFSLTAENYLLTQRMPER